uniref:Uncharacterized protein n=1 Tax=Podoviridae sp. ct6HI6 TaxID=2827616 RepID=A0A8S5LLU4_9CAUD|nr:MAG TPA: hypothetical protein [Podoviridae sp. ct6HI6]
MHFILLIFLFFFYSYFIVSLLVLSINEYRNTSKNFSIQESLYIFAKNTTI